VIVLMVLAYIIILPSVRTQLIEQRKLMAKEMVHSVGSLISGYNSMAINKQLTLAEAQALALESIHNMHYGTGNKDYFWISNLENVILSHPYYKNTEGKIIQDSVFTDPLKRMTELVKQKNEGFLEYTWQWKDDSTRFEAKISYVQLYSEWGWIIGTGFYKNEAHEQIDELIKEILIYSVFITAGLLTFLFVIVRRSITNIKSIVKKENELAYSELRFRGMTNNSLNGLVIYENDKPVFMNKQCHTLLGYDSEENIETEFIDFIVDEEKERVKTYIKSVQRENGQLNEIGFWIRDKRGQKKYILNKLVYERKNVDTVLTYVIASDITEMKTYETKLKQLSETIAQVPASIIITDLEGKIEYVNPPFEKITGYSFEDVYGKSPSILKSGDMPNSMYTDLWRTIKNGKTWNNELLNKKKNGELFWESVIVFPIKNENDRIINYAAVKHDITENKNINEELIKAREKAVLGEKVKTSFLANVSHEVHTPLNAITGFTDLLKEMHTNDAKTLSYLQIIENNSDILLQLFSDILEYSKIESSGMELEKSEFSPNELISKICSKYNSKIATEHKPIDLKFYPDKSLENAIIKSDKRLFSQVLDHLLSNAFKFTSHGHIKVGYIVFDAFIEFYVEDTGTGIAEDEKDKIFELFYHSEKEFISLHKGTGLGLKISKKFIEALGGKISFKSKENVGSTFYFTIPLEKKKELKSTEDVLVGQNNLLKNLKVLIVEDNEANYLFLNRIFINVGSQVFWAQDGVDAIKKVEENSDFDIILMDILMPQMNGIQATQIIKNMGVEIPIIAQSAIADEDLFKNKHLFEATIQKPINKTMLIDLLVGILKERAIK